MASKYRVYIHSAAGADNVAYERWDSGLLPNAPVPTLTSLADLPQAELDGKQWASYQDLQNYANSRGESLHEVDSVEQAIQIIRGAAPIPPADSNFSAYLPWVIGAGAAVFFLWRRRA